MVAFIVDPVGTTFMCLLYIIIGTVSVLCNLVNLVIFLSEKRFREKYLFFIVLELGELVNAFSYMATGLGRLIELNAGRLNTPHSMTECFFKYPWVVLLIAGMELTSLTIFFLSIERICAVAIPMVFKRVFLSPAKWTFIVSIPILTLGSIMLGAYSALGREEVMMPTGHCGIITSTELWYSTFHFGIIMVAYIIAFLSTFLVWSRFKKLHSHRTQKLVVNLAIIGVTTILIGIPSFINIAVRFDWITINDIPYAIGYALPGMVSIANTVISFTLRPDVRRQFMVIIMQRAYLVGLTGSYSTRQPQAVAPINGSTPQTLKTPSK